MQVTLDVDLMITPDLRLLAIRLLEGDPSAADPLVDCYLENRKGGERITPHYVELLEDTLNRFRLAAIQQEPTPLFAPAHSNWWKAVQVAKYLGRNLG